MYAVGETTDSGSLNSNSGPSSGAIVKSSNIMLLRGNDVDDGKHGTYVLYQGCCGEQKSKVRQLGTMPQKEIYVFVYCSWHSI